ncbi:MAG: hypothetical protein HC896_01130 [Bacteroidales bacterium]|nr:hypothetical protein [Bacteroidales bacterium]
MSGPETAEVNDLQAAFRIKQVELINSSFYFKSFNAGIENKGMDFSNMRFNPIDIELRDLELMGDSIGFNIENLMFKDASGFELRKLSSEFSLCDRFIWLRDYSIETGELTLDGKEIKLDFDRFSQFSVPGMYSNVTFNINIDHAQGYVNGIKHFVPSFAGFKHKFAFAGQVTGPLDNLKGKKISLQYANNTEFVGDFELKGLPDIQKTFIYANTKGLSSNKMEVEEIIGAFTGSMFKLPDVLAPFGVVSFNGVYAGLIDDFVTYGKFYTELGEISTDILLSPAKNGQFGFNGKLRSNGLWLAPLLKSDSAAIGNISFSLSANGNLLNDTINAKVNGAVNSLEVNHYTYRNILLSGVIREKDFKGMVSVKDSYLDFDFDGHVDFNSDTAHFDFSANLNSANLYKLNIDTTDKKSTASFLLKAKGKATDASNFNGNISLINSLFVKSDKQLQLYNVDLVAARSKDSARLSVSSSFLDAEITGKYNFKTFLPATLRALRSFVEAANLDTIHAAGLHDNSFKYSLAIKETRGITNFLCLILKLAAIPL